MARIFLSYARDDVGAAGELAKAIGAAGHEVWWDRHLHGGSRFAEEIDQALKNADAVMVLWSPTSIKSAWVQDEAAEGRDSERLVPVTIGSAKPPLGFRQFHTIDLGSWDGHGPPEVIDDLLQAINRTSGFDAKQDEQALAETAKSAVKASICVLPFVNMSGEPEQEYFSDGISEDITTDLSKISALEVVARNTAFSFKGQTIDVSEVARQLHVSHVLEGSVRKAGARVRINAQLIDGSTGKHLWADRFDRDLTVIFEIQDEISSAIVAALKVKLLPQERKAIENRGTASVEAYTLFLMARQQWVSGTFGDIRRDQAIVRLCEQATALDSQYAQAWGLMALAQLELRFWHGKDVNALPAAEQALSINPNLPEAHCVTARYLEEDGKKTEAELQIRTALKLDPDSWEVNREAARMMFRHGHIPDAIAFFRKAVDLTEADWHNAMMLMTCYNSLGDKVAVRAAARTTLERVERTIAKDPTNGPALAGGAVALSFSGDQDRAREWIRRALLLDPDNLQMRYNLACALVLELGDHDAAIDSLRPFFERVNSTTHMRHLEVDPDLDAIRDDPRFKAMLADAKIRLGLEPLNA